MDLWPEYLALVLVMVAMGSLWWWALKEVKWKTWLKVIGSILAIFVALITLGSAYFTFWSFLYYDTDYDAKTEEMAFALREKLNGIFRNYKPEDESRCRYENYDKTYKSIESDIETLQFRVNIIPDNQDSIQYVRILTSSFMVFKELHLNQKNPVCLSRETLERSRHVFDLLIGSLLEHEIEKKPKSIASLVKYILKRQEAFLAPARTFFDWIRNLFNIGNNKDRTAGGSTTS